MAGAHLRFLTWEERRNRPDGLEYHVVVFEPRGIYPRGTRHVSNGFFHADDQIAFSVVLGESWRLLDPDAPYSEFDWASPQELRLIASLILCEVTEGRYIRLYPIVRFGPLLNVSALDLQSSETVAKARALILNPLAQSRDVRDTLSRCRSEYAVVDPTEYALDRLPEFWSAIATPNYVLLRGVYAFMKSDMLSCHNEFWEETLVALYIALDASFQLILRQLKKTGIQNPCRHDAALWLHNHFDAPFGTADRAAWRLAARRSRSLLVPLTPPVSSATTGPGLLASSAGATPSTWTS